MKKVFVIAEAGVNHNGDFILAKELIDIAAASGADAIKFQTFIAKMVMTRAATKAKYQLNKTKDSEWVSTIINVCVVICIMCVIYNFYTGRFSFY